MNKKQTIGLAVAAGLFILIGASSVLTNALSKKALDESVTEMLSLTNGVEFNAPKKDYIAVVNVVGTIEEQIETGAFDTVQSYQHVTTLDYIDKLNELDTGDAAPLSHVSAPENVLEFNIHKLLPDIPKLSHRQSGRSANIMQNLCP